MANPEPRQTRGFMPKDSEGHSLSEVIHEIGTSAKDLVQSEIDLARAEIKESASFLGRHTAEAAVFGGLLVLSVLPFLAFVVIGLGRLLGDRFWLSSLIVAVVCAVVGGAMSYRVYRKIKQADLTLPRTRETLQQEKRTITDKVEDIRDTAQRRAS